jgi:hypothetical protein
MFRYTGVDFAMSASAEADFTVIFTIALDENGVRWIVDIQRGKGWGYQEQLDRIKEVYAKYLPDVIHAEANQMQRIFTDEVVRETDIPIRKFFTSGVMPRQPWRRGMTQLTMGKHHIDRGVPSMRMSLENRKWRIPRGDAKSIEITDIWIGEMMAMGWLNGRVNSVGDHDDTVMACWMADTAARMGGFRFSFGDDATEKGVVPEMSVPGQEVPEIVAGKDLSGYISGQHDSDNFQDAEYDDMMPPRDGAPRASDLGLGIFNDFGL